MTRVGGAGSPGLPSNHSTGRCWVSGLPSGVRSRSGLTSESKGEFT